MIALPTVRFMTDFDTEQAAFGVPIAITKGAHAAIQVTDGFRRGGAIVGRFDTGPGLIGLKVVGGGRPVEVAVTLTADGQTPDWSDRSLANDSSRPYAPRLILVRSQGRSRAAVLLGRSHRQFVFRTRTIIRFRVDAVDLTDDGLFVIELADSKLGPGYGHAPHAASGVRIDAIRITPDPSARTVTTNAAGLVECGLASTGLPIRGARAPLAGDFFAATPGGNITSWRLRGHRVRPVRPDPLRANPGPPWPKEQTGGPQLRMREKAVLLVRHKINQMWYEFQLHAGHLLAQTSRAATAPIGIVGGLGMRSAIRRGRITAEVVLLDTGTPLASTLRYVGRRTVEVTASAPLAAPAIVRLSESRAHRFRYAWQLIGAR